MVCFRRRFFSGGIFFSGVGCFLGILGLLFYVYVRVVG